MKKVSFLSSRDLIMRGLYSLPCSNFIKMIGLTSLTKEGDDELVKYLTESKIVWLINLCDHLFGYHHFSETWEKTGGVDRSGFRDEQLHPAD